MRGQRVTILAVCLQSLLHLAFLSRLWSSTACSLPHTGHTVTPSLGSLPLSCLEHLPLPAPPQPLTFPPPCSPCQDGSVVYFQHPALCQRWTGQPLWSLKGIRFQGFTWGPCQAMPSGLAPTSPDWRLERRLTRSFSFTSCPALEGVKTASPGALEMETDLSGGCPRSRQCPRRGFC